MVQRRKCRRNASSYGADITKIKCLSLENSQNTFKIPGDDFDFANNEAGIVVLIDDDTTQKDIQLLYGNDFSHSGFDSTLDTIVSHTFIFAPATTDWQAEFSIFYSSVAGVVIGSTSFTPDYGAQERDTLESKVDIPAQVTQLTVQALSENRISDVCKPAFFVWTAAAFSIPDEISPAKDRMTGRGSVFTNNDVWITLGFEMYCDLREPNNLQVNWPDGNKLHMLELTYAICTDDPKINQKPPAFPFDPFTGEGTCRFNAVEGATINFILVDQGEPGKSDTGWIQIFEKHEQEVLNLEGSMKYGNLQAYN